MAKLVFPRGYKSGCLPRTRRATDVCKLLKAEWDIFSIDQLMEKIPLQPGLKHFPHHIYDQDGRGSCSNESGSSALATLRVAEGQQLVEYNPWSVYYYTSGGADRGSALYDVVRTLQTKGVCPVDVWPRYDKNGRIVHDFDERPSNEAQAAALNHRLGEFWELENEQEVASAYVHGHAIVYGWQGHSCWIPYIQPPTNKNIGSWVAVYRNSWHISWGDKGHGTIRLSDINFGYQCFAYRSSAIRTDDDTAPPPVE